MDCLHQAGVEIVSPNFMNQRVLSADKTFVPRVSRRTPSVDKQEGLPEAVVFDKADEAESMEKLRERHSQLRRDIESLKSSLSDETDKTLRSQIQKKIEALETRLTRLTVHIAQAEGGEK